LDDVDRTVLLKLVSIKYGLKWLSIQIFRGQSGWGVALTTHPHLAPRLQKH